MSLIIVCYYHLQNIAFAEHVDDVRGIVQRAVKDLSIEQSLKTYEEVWLSKVFQFHLHIRSKLDTGDPNMPVSFICFSFVVACAKVQAAIVINPMLGLSVGITL